MGELFTWILNFLREFKLLAIVLPWERAARVRLGNRVVVWEPGWHLRLPFIDHIEPLNTRLRIADANSQTLTTVDGHTLTIGMNVGFRIADPLAALLKMQHPEALCSALAGSLTSGFVSATTRADVTVAAIEAHVLEGMLRETTYELDFVRVRNFCFARTYRFLLDNGYSNGVSIEERRI